MQPADSESKAPNPNARTIEMLQQMSTYYHRTADHWRTIAYRKAIAALRRQSVKISTKAQALAIPGIGERLADKIEEIVCTDRLRRLENTNLGSEDQALQLFLGVYGAGFSQAARWIAMGYRTLDDLKTNTELTRNQKIGIERYEDFQTRIPRHEVEMLGEVVRKAVHTADRDLEVIIGGSYRRGATDSGDIDLVITKPGASLALIRTIMMDTVVPRLWKQDFLKASLATSSRGDGSKWHGACCLPNHQIWRRIDLLFVPGDEIGAALLYFTGNDIFNRSMRLLARKRGMCLNQHGLFKDVLRNRAAVKENTGSLVEARDERKIFDVLGVPWRRPEQRIC
jgi:DNA polymerase IV